MPKPIVQHPPDNSEWPPKQTLVVQGFHRRPGNLKATLKGKIHSVPGIRLSSEGTLWIFLFPTLAPDTYTLSVSEISGSGTSDPRTFIVKGGFGLPVPGYPQNGDNVTQSFAAWGTSDSTGGDLTAAGPQTMVGYDGTGATTNGTIETQPSATGGTWVVQFQITDTPPQNTYTMSITNSTGTVPVTRINVGLNPPPPP